MMFTVAGHGSELYGIPSLAFNSRNEPFEILYNYIRYFCAIRVLCLVQRY